MAYDKLDSLKGLQGVRKRPGMYVGTTKTPEGERVPPALNQIAREVISNSLDEALNGYGRRIEVIIHKDRSLTVGDEGRGIPMGDAFDAVIRAFTVLHTSGKFDSKNYKSAGGLHGIGAKAANALSKYLTAEVVRSDIAYTISFEQEKVTSKESRKPKRGEKTGTRITFLPDDTIFDNIEWDLPTLREMVEHSSYVSAGVEFVITDERLVGDKDEDDNQVPYTWTFRHDEGMKDLAKTMSDGAELIGFTEPIRVESLAEFDGSGSFKGLIESRDEAQKDSNIVSVEIALCYTEELGEEYSSITNGIINPLGGTHLDGAHLGIQQVFNEAATHFKKLKKGKKLDGADTREGLVVAVSVGVPEDIIDFDGQVKSKLLTKEAKRAVQETVIQKLALILYDNEKPAALIIDKMMDAQNVRQKMAEARAVSKEARKAKRGSVDSLFTSSKLAPASSKSDPLDRELFIVEGDSAGGSGKKARNRHYQAILPLRGKPKNAFGKLSEVIKNEEVSTIISTVGAGIGQDFDISQAQYGKVVIMADADDDGYHIAELVILIFWRLMPEMIKQGRLYIANAPLFRLDTYKKGKRIKKFALDLKEYEKLKAENPGWHTTRLKGLGEMDAAELAETTMQRGTRRLTKLNVRDAKEVARRLELYMGKGKINGVSAADLRKDWIFANVKFHDDEVLSEEDVFDGSENEAGDLEDTAAKATLKLKASKKRAKAQADSSATTPSATTKRQKPTNPPRKSATSSSPAPEKPKRATKRNSRESTADKPVAPEAQGLFAL